MASRSYVIGITHDVDDVDDSFLVDADRADAGSSSPTFSSLNLDDFCGVVSSGFDFEEMLLNAKHKGQSFMISAQFPLRLRR